MPFSLRPGDVVSSCWQTWHPVNWSTDNPSKDLFALSANAPSALKKVIAEFKRQDKITGFMKELLITEGKPLWEKSLFELSKKNCLGD